MDFRTDIEKPVLYWVKNKKITSHSLDLWGAPIACTPGLGGDSRSFYGRAAFISPAERLEGHVSITRVHVNGKGYHLSIDKTAPVELPQEPFLITNHLALRFLRQQKISFEPAQKWEEQEDDDEPGEYHVCCQDWMGVLHVENASKRSGELWIFSDRPDVSVAPGTPLAFCADPDEIFATVS